ncbi:perlucin-like [Biomphalaria glabrata]|uniref:Perlucin-like n=1 Tax=Biomphalaria glabrata TaxID=6526 RepID=A0A9W3B7T5_BIOGL|nr:perlucin-like [Biomphalaria glabrata]KAI8757187.1 C-type lectin domain family 4 member M-like; partial [Biomphalaria glabrata]
MQYSRKAFEATSPLDCARKCQLQKCASFSFSNHVCSIGQCNSTNATLGLSQEIYVSCFSSDGFTFIPFGSVSACVWVSTNITDYITARDDCRSKDGHLYTLKTMDKLKWLQTYYNRTKIWIGLNDIDVEGTYRWEDDYTVCSQSWMKQIFAPGEPNNRKSSPNGEDCIHFYQNVPLLNDANCLTNYTYICEKPFFNLH